MGESDVNATLLSSRVAIMWYMEEIMPRYTFKINELEYRTVDALDLDDARERAGITELEPDCCTSDENDDFCDQCFITAIIDEVLS